MKLKQIIPAVLIAALTSSSTASAQAQDKPVPVTVKNFQRAESDLYFGNFVKQGGFGKLFHYRTPTPIDKQDVVRMNRDTLYPGGVFDLDAGPVTVTLPDAGKRFMSLQTVTEDHYSPATRYAPVKITLTRKEVGTRYVALIARTLVNPGDPADVQAVNALQDQIKIEQPGGPSQWDAPNWDPVTQAQVRDHLAGLQALGGCTGIVRMGTREAVDPVCHLLATATGWGLNPQEDAVYNTVYPKANDGKTVHKLTVKDVPVDGFWSISVYNAKGYFEKNDLDSYDQQPHGEAGGRRVVHDPVRRLHERHAQLPGNAGRVELRRAAVPAPEVDPRRHLEVPGGAARSVSPSA